MASPGKGPSPIDEAREKVRTSNFFALCYLMLCQLSYANENKREKAIDQITKLLPTMPAPRNAPVDGRWALGWGPEATDNNSNLMYAAEFVDKAINTPVFSAVVIRGTDTEAKPSGILTQIVEDLDAADQVSFPQDDKTGSRIAQGTAKGLKALLDFRDPPKTGRTIEDYVQTFVTSHRGAPVVVTGHSLGGCQTTVLALDLAAKLPPGTIVPNTFAGPTAGNAAFVHLYEKTFTFAPRWFNDIDLVPNAFASLDAVKDLWKKCDHPAPDIIPLLINGFKLVLAAKNAYYKQPDAQSRKLSGACQRNRPSAVSSVVQNQAVVEIEALMQRSIPKLQDTAKKFTDGVEKLADKIGLDAPVHFLTAKAVINSPQNFAAWVEELLFQHLIMSGYWDLVAAQQDVAKIDNPFAQAAGATA
jgi:hypothetical protein